MECNTQATSRTASLSIEEEFVSVVCKKCGAEYILFRVLRHRDEFDTKDVVEIWRQASWSYCPVCGIKNDNPRGMSGK